MKTSAIVTLAFVFFARLLSAADAAGDQAIVDLEKKAWQSYKDHQPDAFKGLMGPDYAAVYAEGIKDINGELGDMKNVELRSFDMTNTRVSHPSAEVAMLTFTCAVQGSAEGKDISGTYNCGSVYLKQNGKWVGVFHAEAKADK
jgi:Domain of unknown function (DUF4440)